MSKPAVPTFAIRWEPPAPGTVMPRPRIIAPSSATAPPPQADPFEGVERDECPSCGWRFSKHPTRCKCIGANTLRTAPPSAEEEHWTERYYP